MSTVSGSGSSDTPNPLPPWDNPYLALRPCPICDKWGSRHDEDCPNA